MSVQERQAITIRLHTEILERLKNLTEDGVSVNYLISKAIKEFLDAKVTDAQMDRPAITVEEIEAVIPVLKALGKSVHVDLFFELIDTQQGR